MTYFDQIDAINDNFDQFYVHKPDWNNFYKHFEKFFWPLSLNFGLWRNFGPKMTKFWPFSTKMTYFDQIDPINAIFDQIYVHKPDWNNF